VATQSARIRAVFDQAQELGTQAERAAFLDQACVGQPEVRREVESLLRALDLAGDFLTHPAGPEVDLTPPSEETTLVARPGAAREAGPAPEGTDPAVRAAGEDAAAVSWDLAFLQPPTRPGTLGRFLYYEVREVLGRGAFGLVLRAFDERLHRLVAIKVLNAQLADNDTARRRFLREARAAAAVSSEHVVGVYAVDEQPVPYLVMEHVAGQTLQQRRGTLHLLRAPARLDQPPGRGMCLDLGGRAAAGFRLAPPRQFGDRHLDE
jgi:hypothetical protein